MLVGPELGEMPVTVGASAKTGIAMNTEDNIPKIRINTIRYNFPFIKRFLNFFKIGLSTLMDKKIGTKGTTQADYISRLYEQAIALLTCG
jgi:hypothetical protein